MFARTSPIILSFLGLFLVYNASFAQQVKRISNINQYTQTRETTSQISASVEFNNKSIQIQSSIYGNELWEYDGTNPPSLIMDINPGTQSGVRYDLIVFDNKVFFAGNDGINGSELWAYDGINPPYMVAELNTNGSSTPIKFTIFQNKLYFVASTSTHNNLIWAYDGTNPPSHPTHLNFQYNNAYNDEFIVFDNQLFCTRYKNTTGNELYRYDGINPPVLVQDINSGSGGSYPHNLTIYDNKLFFTANNGSLGEELWMYDGTQASLVSDMYPGSNSAFSSYSDFAVYNNQLVFSANDGINGEELWAYDGNQLNLLNDLLPGIIGSEPRDLTVVNNKLYFSSSQPSTNFLWAYDGINIDTVHADISSIRNILIHQNKLLFQGYYPYNIDGVIDWGWGSFIYDGILEPQLIGKERITTDASSEVKNLTVYNGMLYFSAFDELTETKLWRFNGLSEDPNSIKKVQNSYVSYPENLTVIKDQLYFSGQIDDQNSFIWQYDGLNRPSSFSKPYNQGVNALNSFCEYQDQLFFASSNYNINDYELWSIDGDQFTAITEDSILYPQYSPRELLVYKGDLYFVLNDYIHGEEIWKYDGQNLTCITDVSPSFSSSSNPSILDLIVFKDKLYFNAWDGTERNLWAYDGQNPPSIAPNASNCTGYKNEAIVFQDKLYYIGYDSHYGYELWGYDGVNPASMVTSLTNDSCSSSFPHNFAILNNQLYFAAFSEYSGIELWSYDGVNSPQMVADIAESIIGSSPTDLTVFNDKLYFAADDGVHGIELWEYNPDTTQQFELKTPSNLKALLYPNPSNGRVNIDFEAPCLNPRVHVVYANGQVVLDKQFSSTDHIVLELDRANTIYFIRVESEDGQCFHSKVVMN